MNNKNSSVHLVFTIVHFSLAIATLIPLSTASKASLLGYKALCSFSPVSTIGLILLSLLHILMYKGILVKK